MKKVALLFSALALVLGLSQCKKVRPDMPHYSGSVGDKYIQEVKLTAAYPKGNSKVSVEDDATSLLKLKWQIGDELTVGGTGAGSKNLKCTSVSEDGLTGTFEGIITASEGTVTFTYGSKPTPYENQVGTLEGLKNLVCLEGSATFNQDGNYNNVPMKLPYAILKLDLSALGSADGNTVTVKVASETKASVLNVTNTATGLYVALPTENEYDAPDPTEETYTFEGNDKSVDKVLTIKKSVYYTKSGSSTGDPIEVKPEPSYVCFEAVEAGSTVYLAGLFAPPSNMSISTDGGNTWADFSAPVTLSNVGDKCYFKSKTKRDKVTDSWGISCKFSGSGNIKVSGNIMALLDGNNPASEMTEDNAGCFQQLFQNCAATIDASELVLPATTLAANCYNDMFKNCTSLVDASNITLSATTLAEGCYQQMFDGCTNLVTAPVLKAETFASNSCNLMFSDCSSLKETPAMTIKAVADNCCSNMFCGCTSLEDASNISLSATKLAANCYFGMFGFSSTSACCSSLKKAPAMSATEAANNCCEQMFKDCKSLVDVSGITFATTLADDCYNCMFEGCSSLETAPASLPATTLKKNCYIGMFTNCTSLKTVPDMSAIETVATNCCDAMFRGCTSLETAPDLKAATLAPNCYYQMFCGCSKLTTAPAISATTLATYCCGSMFYGCTSLETAPELKATTLVEGCYYSIFYGCAKLSSVTMLATDINATNCLNTWLGYDSGTAGTSTASPKVYVASGMKNAVEGTVPFNWTVEVKP